MPNTTWPPRPERPPSTLTIEPAAKPGFYDFSIGGQNISRWIDFADILFFNRDRFQPGELNIGTPVEVPPQIKVILFTGEKTNGSNRSS